MTGAPLDFERCYRAVESRDARFDGWFITAVRTTGIYCRPGCPTPVRPKRENVQFYPTAAAAQLAGYRACKRCRPDASPGSPEWNVRGDLVGRAMRLIADGTVDREGVAGLASRLAVSERHLHRLLLGELGAGPLAIARAQRAQSARTLIETTDLPFTDVAFAAGFESIRQFNDTIREVFALPPTELRRRGRRRDPGTCRCPHPVHTAARVDGGPDQRRAAMPPASRPRRRPDQRRRGSVPRPAPLPHRQKATWTARPGRGRRNGARHPGDPRTAGIADRRPDAGPEAGDRPWRRHQDRRPDPHPSISRRAGDRGRGSLQARRPGDPSGDIACSGAGRCRRRPGVGPRSGPGGGLSETPRTARHR